MLGIKKFRYYLSIITLPGKTSHPNSLHIVPLPSYQKMDTSLKVSFGIIYTDTQYI